MTIPPLNYIANGHAEAMRIVHDHFVLEHIAGWTVLGRTMASINDYLIDVTPTTSMLTINIVPPPFYANGWVHAMAIASNASHVSVLGMLAYAYVGSQRPLHACLYLPPRLTRDIAPTTVEARCFHHVSLFSPCYDCTMLDTLFS